MSTGYWTTARAQLFRRDHAGIKGMEEMKSVMRQCNYKTDPLSHQQCLDGYIEDTKTFHQKWVSGTLVLVESFSATDRLLDPAKPSLRELLCSSTSQTFVYHST